MSPGFEEAAKTAALLPELYEVLKLRLSDESERELLKNIEMPLSLVLSNMEKEGFWWMPREYANSAKR